MRSICIANTRQKAYSAETPRSDRQLIGFLRMFAGVRFAKSLRESVFILKPSTMADI